ncbi:putative F-box domain, galactose oxidase/kelch, beta-propeller, F-box associated interaction [Helianthus annuus]|nr:putative F-box domain, galactose oxidase/kelch, beta-propeller, F-box associated interaction [Helianthus annuus]
MADLPTHTIVFEILTRLPAKDVGRSKSVCKQWYALLSTQDFVKIHCSRSVVSSNQRVLLIDDLTCSVRPIISNNNDYGPSSTVTFPFHHQNNDVSILSHLNGLLCVCLNHTYELLLWNPTTTAFKRLSTPDSHGFYINNLDAIGLYVDADDDYKVLHIKRRSGVLGVYVYSREVDSWRNIPFITRQEYLSPYFNWSAGTFCGGTLYFTVCECWIGGTNVVICFDVNSEQFKEISFPPVPSNGMVQGVLVNVKNVLHMFASTGMFEMTIDLWTLQGDYWIKVLSCPPIPPISLSLWCDITHYVTNGNWFVMTKLGKLFTIEMDMKPFECFYPVSWFRGFKGAVFVQTIVSPSI